MIKKFALFESELKQKELSDEQKAFLNVYVKGSWTQNPQTGLVDIEGEFRCVQAAFGTPEPSSYFLRGIKFGKVTKGFRVIGIGLTSLEGAPIEVGGDFVCSHNYLTSLVGSPRTVGRDFRCDGNEITSLFGCPDKIGGEFCCRNNSLTDLKNGPSEIGGTYMCAQNNLTTLEGAPEICEGDFVCDYNLLKNLKGAPKEVRGDFSCGDNPLESLEGAPKQIWGGFSYESILFDPDADNYDDNYDEDQPGEWGDQVWVNTLANDNVTQTDKKLMLTLLSPDYLNAKIRKDPAGVIDLIAKIWDLPIFASVKSQLSFPASYGNVDDLIKRKNRVRGFKDYI